MDKIAPPAASRFARHAARYRRRPESRRTRRFRAGIAACDLARHSISARRRVGRDRLHRRPRITRLEYRYRQQEALV